MTTPRTHHPVRVLVVLAVVLASLGGGVLLASAQAGPVTKGGPQAPGFVNYTAPEGLGQDAAEPSIGVNHETGKVLFQALLETLQVTFDDATSPPTAEWKDVSPGITSTTTLDPILHTDPVTGRTFVSQLLPPCSVAAFTDSDGEPSDNPDTAYTPILGCGAGSNFDHQTIVAGPAKNPELSPAYGPGRLVYYCSQVIVEATCSVSRDGGLTFEASSPTYTIDLGPGDGCAGLHGHLEVGPDGNAYLPNMSCGSGEDERVAVAVSEDDGLTWSVRKIPDSVPPNFDADPAVAVDEGGRAYVAYENDTSNAMLAMTDDQGRTFTPSIDLGAPFGIDNATMPAAIAGSEGRAAVAFLGTEAEAPENEEGEPENQLAAFDPDEGDPEKGWHLYVSTTFDGGATWETVDVTPTDPVQRGCIWWGSARAAGEQEVCQSNPDRNLLDFIEMAVDAQGRILVGYADGCVAECVTDPDIALEDGSAARDDVGVIARQQCGRGLFAEFDDDPAGPLAACPEGAASPPASPRPTPSASTPASPAPTGTASPEPTGSPSASPSAPPPSEPAAVDRLGGRNRLETAVSVAEEAYPDGTDTVVVARSDAYPDALTGAPLAVDLDAPLLLSDSGRLSDETADAIARLGATRAVLLGGTAALSEQVRTDLEARSVTVDRVAGSDRYATAAEIAGRLGSTSGRAFLVEGFDVDPTRGFPDALSAAPYAAFVGDPVLLTTTDELPQATKDALFGLDEVVVVGGRAAVSDRVAQEARSGRIAVRRVAGSDRYATSVAVGTEALGAGMDASVLWLATGLDWPDALTSGAAVGAGGDSFLLVDGADLEASAATADAIAGRASRIETVHLVGGSAAVSDQVRDQVEARLAR